jgi:hypothetical protein
VRIVSFAASPAQRAKVKNEPCIVCGQGPCDPMHVCARGQGGCDEPLCVVPGCRRCHRLYDTGKLDLLPYLEPHYRPELAHALEHLGLVGLYRRVTNERLAA